MVEENFIPAWAVVLFIKVRFKVGSIGYIKRTDTLVEQVTISEILIEDAGGGEVGCILSYRVSTKNAWLFVAAGDLYIDPASCFNSIPTVKENTEYVCNDPSSLALYRCI